MSDVSNNDKPIRVTAVAVTRVITLLKHDVCNLVTERFLVKAKGIGFYFALLRARKNRMSKSND